MTIPLTCLVLVMLLCCWIACHRQQQIANPVTLYCAILTPMVVFAPIVFEAFGLLSGAESGVPITLWMTSLYIACFAIPFWFEKSFLDRPFALLFPANDPQGLRRGAFGMFCLVFFLLMFASGVPAMWITNPRLAYQGYRAGVGVLWALSGAYLYLTFCACIVKLKTRKSVFGLCLIFVGISYFLGSKAIMLGFISLGIVYIQHRLIPLSIKALFAAGFILICGQIALQLVQGTASSFFDTLRYYDYFADTALFMSNFRSFGHTYGATMLGDLWAYVPRAIYPQKPFAYGDIRIMEYFNPGMAELGSTPGILPWTPYYLDFGALGVVAAGLFTGMFAQASYNLFRRSRTAVACVVFAQIGSFVAGIFSNAPLLIFWVWLVLTFFLLRVFWIAASLLADAFIGY